MFTSRRSEWKRDVRLLSSLWCHFMWLMMFEFPEMQGEGREFPVTSVRMCRFTSYEPFIPFFSLLLLYNDSHAWNSLAFSFNSSILHYRKLRNKISTLPITQFHPLTHSQLNEKPFDPLYSECSIKTIFSFSS